MNWLKCVLFDCGYERSSLRFIFWIIAKLVISNKGGRDNHRGQLRIGRYQMPYYLCNREIYHLRHRQCSHRPSVWILQRERNTVVMFTRANNANPTKDTWYWRDVHIVSSLNPTQITQYRRDGHIANSVNLIKITWHMIYIHMGNSVNKDNMMERYKFGQHFYRNYIHKVTHSGCQSDINYYFISF